MFYNTGLEVIFAGVFGACVAQILKVASYFLTHKNMNFKIFTTTGGMPSSHSAGVIALSTSVGLVAGFTSVSFAVAFGYALVVLQDAAGLRRAAGKTAAMLNRLVNEFNEHRNNQAKPYEVLMELLGHTPFEVFMGAILGITMAFWVHYSMPDVIPPSFFAGIFG